MLMRTKVKINSLFQYFYLMQQYSIMYLQQLAESRSGTFPQITFSEVSTIKISLPVFDLVNTFVEIALKPFYENQFQEMLINLRDTLLPKLNSGELEVAEILVEDKNKYKNEFEVSQVKQQQCSTQLKWPDCLTLVSRSPPV